MTVGQFRKFFSMFTLADSKIYYYDSNDYSVELDSEDIFDNYIVTGYFISFENNSVSVFVKVV